MKLTELEPEWCADFEPASGSFRAGQGLTIEAAQGILFNDPTADSAILVWFKGRVPDTAEPGPGRWTPSGTGFHDLTLTPSIDVSCGGKFPGRWHGWITAGEVT